MDQQKPIAASKYPTSLSRDEMNLAEFPLTILSTRAAASVKTLEFRDLVRGKNGETLERDWIITGADKFGLPTASDDEVLLGLMKLTVDDGFRDRKVFFTRYELLRILRWTTEGRSYQRLQKALDRLTGVKIKATNAFYDNATRCHSTRHFGIVDSYEINDGRNIVPKPSFFTWSEVIFNSFKVGFIKKLDLNFYLDLQSAVSKRLYRFLDKHFWYKSKVQMNLFMLAHEKIGISRNYRFASSLRQQLDPALTELQERNFIAGFEYEGRGEDTQVSIYAQSGKPRVSDGKQRTQMEVLPGPKGAAAGLSLRARVQEALRARGIKETQLERLLAPRNDTELERILAIVAHFDGLRAAQSHLVSRSPVGFLYRAVENPLQFVLPGDTPENLKRGEPRGAQTLLNLHGTSLNSAAREGRRPAAVLRKKNEESLEAQYLTQRRAGILRARSEVEPDLLKRMTAEVEKALAKVKRSISVQRFQEVMEHGVDEKLAELFALPSFEQWAADRG